MYCLKMHELKQAIDTGQHDVTFGGLVDCQGHLG